MGSRTLCALLAATSLLCAPTATGAIINVACPGVGTPLQAAIDAAGAGDTVQISGVCNESVLVRNEKQRLVITGVGVGPGVHGLPGTQPAINIRGKGIAIQNLALTGGRDGIHVNRGANAVISNLTIASGGLANIRVDQQSFAVITSSTLTGSTFGVFVDGSSDVRIGFNQDTDAAASPNTIQSALTGIWVQGNSRARIAGNVIKSNTNYGITVRQNSHAEIGGNDIGSNGDFGIYVVWGGSADLSPNEGGTPAFMQTLNNSNSGVNGFQAVVCNTGSYVRGLLGTLSGISGPRLIVAPCQDYAS